MIKLFEANATVFTSNGIRILNNVAKAYSEEVLNGLYSAEFEVVYDELGKWKDIINGMIIFADEQPFRIYKTKKNLRSLTVYTRHVFWDLLNNEVRDARPTNKTAQGAMDDILSGTNYTNSFTAFSDVSTISTQYYINKNPIDCLIGSDSLITRWGGELKLDKWLIKILVERGTDNGVSVAYRKNMLSVDVEEDYDPLITRMRPLGVEGLELPEVYIDSPYIDNYLSPIVREISFDVDNETDLRAAANQYYIDTKSDIPLTNIKVDIALLENTKEYKSFQNLVRINLGDTVTCKHLDLDINYKAKIIRIKKDLTTGKNAEVELGSFKKNLTSAFTKIQNTFNDISEVIVNNKSSLQLAIDNATTLLTSALGGYVVKRNGEMLIMDTEDPATAVKVWRWSINGLGYSSTGINGPYGLAITMDGNIVADFITVGTLTGVKIESVLGNERIEIEGTSIKSFSNDKKAIDISKREIDFFDWGTSNIIRGGLSGTLATDGTYVLAMGGTEYLSLGSYDPAANVYWPYIRIVPSSRGSSTGVIEIRENIDVGYYTLSRVKMTDVYIEGRKPARSVYAGVIFGWSSKYSSSGVWIPIDYSSYGLTIVPQIINFNNDGLPTEARNITKTTAEICMSGTASGTVQYLILGIN